MLSRQWNEKAGEAAPQLLPDVARTCSLHKSFLIFLLGRFHERRPPMRYSWYRKVQVNRRSRADRTWSCSAYRRKRSLWGEGMETLPPHKKRSKSGHGVYHRQRKAVSILALRTAWHEAGIGDSGFVPFFVPEPSPTACPASPAGHEDILPCNPPRPDSSSCSSSPSDWATACGRSSSKPCHSARPHP